MAKSADIPSITIFEDSGAVLMRHIVGNDRVAIQQADITSATRNVYDRQTLVLGPTTLTVADVVFDTIQTDARWTNTEEATGYNFRDDVPATAFPTGDRVYRVEWSFVPASGENFKALYDVHTKCLVTS